MTETTREPTRTGIKGAVAGWRHEDGTPCLTHLNQPGETRRLWCTEHQKYIPPGDPSRGLITDDDLDCLDTLDVDSMTVAVSDLHALAPRLRARWVAEALESLATPALRTLSNPDEYLRQVAGEYRAGKR